MPKRDDHPTAEKATDKRHKVVGHEEKSETTGSPNKSSENSDLTLDTTSAQDDRRSSPSSDTQPERTMVSKTKLPSGDGNQQRLTVGTDPSSHRSQNYLSVQRFKDDAQTHITSQNGSPMVDLAPCGDKRTRPAVGNAKKTDQINTATITIRSIIPNPTADLIDDKQVAHYDQALRSRLETLSSYVNKGANVYALGKLLPTATWGAFLPLADHRSELCNPATNEPLIVWTVGHIATTWFTKDGTPERQASISVIPLSRALMNQYDKLVTGLSIPQIDTYSTMGVIRAVKWQSEKGSTNPTLFEEVYDAREVFANKKDMAFYSVTDLKKNDLVVIEGKITKYRMKDVDNKWSLQRVQMELTAISLLHCNNSEEVDVTDSGREITGLHI